MIYIETGSTDVYYNFGLEHYFATEKRLPDTVFLFWRTTPTLMVGKYQNILEEINKPYADAHGIHLVRRMSGGGTIYTDLGGWQFTFIEHSPDQQIEFAQYIGPVVDAVRELGADASFNGRNDLLIDGKKFSGNAQYRLGDCIVHHGSLLYDTNIEQMVASTTVDPYKILSKSIKSVRDRVTNISEHLPRKLSVEEFKSCMVRHLMRGSTDTYAVTPEDDARIVLRGNGIGIRTAAHQMSHHTRFKFLNRKLPRQVFGDIRHAVTHGFDAFGENFIGVNRGGRDHLLNVRVIEQRAMMHNAVAQSVLRVAGKLLTVDQKIIAAVETGIRTKFTHGIHDRSNVLGKFDLLVGRMLDKCELPAAEIGVDRPSAGHAAHEMNPMRIGIRLVDLLENILVLADHQCRRRAPEEKNRVGQALFGGKIVFQSKIIVNVGRAGLNINHARPPVPPTRGRNCGPAAQKPHAGTPCAAPAACIVQSPLVSRSGQASSAFPTAGDTVQWSECRSPWQEYRP